MFRLKRCLFAGILGVLLWQDAGFLLHAQEVRATLGGRVTDTQGAVIPNANVMVVNEATGVKQDTHANTEGVWSVQFLLPGRYHFSVTSPGFKTASRTGLVLQAGDNKQIDVSLEVGESSQTITVNAETPLIDTTSAVSGTVITEEEINEIPSQSHVATLLAQLSPGVVGQYQNGNVVHMWSYLGASQFTANGGRNNTYSNFYLLDGMPDEKAGGDISFIPAQDSLSQFRVQVNAYDASIERQAGSTINMETKSGTNRFHGNLYEYNQTNVWNANLFQTNRVGGAIPPVHFNEFGATLGGPIWIPKLYNGKNKTFFFVAWDDTYNVDPRPGGTRSMPTALERQGDFTQSFTTQLINNNLVRYPILIYDPATVDKNGNRQLFPGDKIPASRLDPISLNILKYVPLPNTQSAPTSNATNNFVSSATRSDTFPVVSFRLDQNWNNSQRSFFVFRWAHLNESLDNFFHNVATGNEHERTPENVGVDHVSILNANNVLDMRFAVNRYLEPNHDDGAGFDPTQLGFSRSFVSKLAVLGFPRIAGIAGDFGTGQAGGYTNNTYYSWLTSLTHTQGTHSIRLGGEFWILQEADGSLGAPAQFNFDSNVWTRQNNVTGGSIGQGSNFASFLLGLPNAGSIPNNATGFYSQYFTSVYFQDDWRVNARLTLNLGLHWDYERPVQERYNRMTTNYDPSITNPISPAAQAAYAQILANPSNNNNAGVQILRQLVPASGFRVPGAQLFAGVNGQSRNATHIDWKQWQPRFGFAYRIGQNTVFRGGFGRFTQAAFERGGQNGFSTSTPLIASQDNFVNPYDTLANPFRNGLNFPTGSSLGPLTNLGQGVDWLNQDPGHFYSWEYSFHLQHQIGKWLFEAGYSHNKTYNIYWGFDQNLQPFQEWQQLLTPQFDNNGRPQDVLRWNIQVPNPFYKLPGVTGGVASSQTIALNQLLRPNPLLSSITENDNPWGKNQYDAMLVKVQRRFSNGFSILNAFTWSKLFEDTSLLATGPVELLGRKPEHKLGGEDRTLVLSIAPVWEIPFGRNKRWGSNMPRVLDYVVGGWQLSGTYRAQSGIPVVFGTSSFFTGNNFGLPNDQRSLDRWFDTSQFAPFPNKGTDVTTYPAWTGVQNLPGYNYKPTAADLNNGIRNGVYQDFATYIRNYPTRWGNVRGPGVNNFDLGLYKNIRPTERTRLQLRLEVYNALNHPRFDAPNTNPGDPQFGRITPAQQNNARVLQLAGKLYF